MPNRSYSPGRAYIIDRIANHDALSIEQDGHVVRVRWDDGTVTDYACQSYAMAVGVADTFRRAME